jgi:hypothetical protein
MIGSATALTEQAEPPEPEDESDPLNSMNLYQPVSHYVTSGASPESPEQ